MIRKLCIVLTIIYMCISHSQASTISNDVSGSGLAYSLIKMPDNSRVSVQIAYPGRWAFDEGKNQAVPYIGAQLLLAGGAKDYSASEVLELFEDMNSEGNLIPTADYVIGTLHFSPQHQDETLKIVNAHLRNPSLDEQWFDRIRGQFSSQIKETRVTAQSKGFEAMRWAVFGDQAVRASLSLDEANMIEEVTLEEVANWVKTVFNRSGVTIVVAGDLDVNKANTIVDTLFEGFPVGDAIDQLSVDTDFSPERILMHVPDAKTSTLSFIAQLPPTREGSEFEDILLANSLGGGTKSVLFDAVRTKLRASYSFGATITGFSRDARILLLSGQVETEKINEAEQVIRQSYTEFRAKGPKADLQKLKDPLRKNLKVSLEDTGSTSFSALMAKLDGRDIAQEFSLLEELEAVSKESMMQRLTTSFPTMDDFTVVVSSPDAGALEKACVITEPKQIVDCQ